MPVRKLRLNLRERREKLPWKLGESFRNQTIHVLVSSKHGCALVKGQTLVIFIKTITLNSQGFQPPKCRNPTAGLTRAG